MDRRLFEFWGQLFLDLARTQRHMEDMNRLFREGLTALGAFAFPFPVGGDQKKGGGLDGSGATGEPLGQADNPFQESLRQIMALWNMVPKEDYDLLARRLSEAEGKVEEYEQTIHTLKGLVGERQSDPLAATNDLQGLLARQQEAFESLLDNLGRLFQEKEDTSSSRKRKA